MALWINKLTSRLLTYRLSSDFLYGVRGTHIVAARKCQKAKMLFAASLAFCYICNAKSKRFFYENFARSIDL